MNKLATACTLSLTIGILGAAPAADAGSTDDGNILVAYSVIGGHDPGAVGDNLIFELFDQSDVLVPGCSASGNGNLRRCDFGENTSSLADNNAYAIGVNGLDNTYEVIAVTCNGAQSGVPVGPLTTQGLDTNDFPAASIAYGSGDKISCRVTIAPKDNGVRVRYQVQGGDDPDAAGDALEFKLFEEGGDEVTGCVAAGSGSLRSCLFEDSQAGPGVYVLGLSNVDNAYWLRAIGCSGAVVAPRADRNSRDVSPDEVNFKVFGNAYFTYNPGDPVECTLFFRPKPILYIDKVVDNSAAAATASTLDARDFTIEIYDDGGELVPTGSIVDPDDAQCAPSLPSNALCAAVHLANGNFTMGEVLPEYGYEATDLSCTTPLAGKNSIEILPTPGFAFTHSNVQGTEETLCTLTNQYVSQTVRADIDIINDSGRTATGADFIIEVFDSSGNLVASGIDPEPGNGNTSVEFILPIGPYTFGVDGPDGYDTSATVTPTGQPAGIEIIDTGADFTLTRTQGAVAIIRANDQAATTTTTTATTTTTTVPTTTTAIPTTTVPTTAMTATVPTTTATSPTTTTAPTTIAPTTAAPTTTTRAQAPPTRILPATGSNTTSTSPLVLLALVLITLGGGVLVGARRP